MGIFDALVQGVVEVQGEDGEQGRAKSVRVYVYLLHRQYKSPRCSRVVVRTRLIMPSQHALETFLPGACSRTTDGQLYEDGTCEVRRPTDILTIDTHYLLLKVNIDIGRGD